ncbi:hypothetical protein ACIP6X_06105 [Streptomyces coeruleorubidus]|uniref:hypothetical protein n=1 Tax=Streptomyces coeruleorubidus TaxID=116188 RepID=UPI003822F6B8
MNEIDELIGQILRDNAERKTLYGIHLADMEERLQQAEEDALKAYEGFAERGTLKGSGMGGILARQERLRAEVNTLWAELDKPAPDFSVFHGKA